MSLMERILRLRTARKAASGADGWPVVPEARPAPGEPGHAWPAWTVLRAGTVLYYGCRDDFDPARPQPFTWMSRSVECARFFATRMEEVPGFFDGRKARVVSYLVEADVALPLIQDEGRPFRAFRKAFGIGDADNEERREGVERAGLPGWVVPGRYDDEGGPGGDDVLVGDTSVLSLRSTSTERRMPDTSWGWVEEPVPPVPSPAPR